MWQDKAISVIQVGFSIMLLPTLLDAGSQVPRVSSGLTALGLAALAVIFASRGDRWASRGSLLAAGVWGFIFALRPVVG